MLYKQLSTKIRGLESIILGKEMSAKTNKITLKRQSKSTKYIPKDIDQSKVQA